MIQAGSRERFLDEVLRFVRSAANLPGVLRIALVGSILTDRPDPKDVDVLVSVTDDAELAPLAALGRRLQGRLQSLKSFRALDSSSRVGFAIREGYHERA